MSSQNVIFKKLSPGDLQELTEISRRTFNESFGADNNPLGVWEKNIRAMEFYKRNHFEFSGTHPYMVGNDLQTDIIMKLFLK